MWLLPASAFRDADYHYEIPFLLCVVRDCDRMNAIELVEADDLSGSDRVGEGLHAGPPLKS